MDDRVGIYWCSTHWDDFSSSVFCRVGSCGCPSSCLSRSTSCFATAYSPSVRAVILTRRSAHLSAHGCQLWQINPQACLYVLSCDRCLKKISLKRASPRIRITRTKFKGPAYFVSILVDLGNHFISKSDFQQPHSCNAPLANSSKAVAVRFPACIAILLSSSLFFFTCPGDLAPRTYFSAPECPGLLCSFAPVMNERTGYGQCEVAGSKRVSLIAFSQYSRYSTVVL